MVCFMRKTNYWDKDILTQTPFELKISPYLLRLFTDYEAHILRKKLRGRVLTNSEQTIYSVKVKKKIRAIMNLQELGQLLER